MTIIDDVTGAWDRSVLPENVRLGRDVWLEARRSFERFRSTRADGLTIGDGCRIYTWTTFNIEPAGHLRIGTGCVLVGAVFMCAEEIVVGDGVVISYGVTIADADFHPRDPDARRADAIANAPGSSRAGRPALESRPVRIDDGAWIGIGAIVLKGVTIGAGARIGAGSVVTRNVPAGAFVGGNPARPTSPEDTGQ